MLKWRWQTVPSSSCSVRKRSLFKFKYSISMACKVRASVHGILMSLTQALDHNGSYSINDSKSSCDGFISGPRLESLKLVREQQASAASCDVVRCRRWTHARWLTAGNELNQTASPVAHAGSSTDQLIIPGRRRSIAGDDDCLAERARRQQLATHNLARTETWIYSGRLTWDEKWG